MVGVIVFAWNLCKKAVSDLNPFCLDAEADRLAYQVGEENTGRATAA